MANITRLEAYNYPTVRDMLWRTGKSLGRTIYAQTSDSGEDDIYLGMMELPVLAEYVCSLHNERLEWE